VARLDSPLPLLHRRREHVVVGVDGRDDTARREPPDYLAEFAVGEGGVLASRGAGHDARQRAVVDAALVELGRPVEVSLGAVLEQLRDGAALEAVVLVLALRPEPGGAGIVRHSLTVRRADTKITPAEPGPAGSLTD